MWQLPVLPSWDGLHPIIIHFPIVLTLIAPIFTVLAMPKWKARIPMAMTAGALLAAAGAAAWMAVSTGEEAGELALRTPDISIVLEAHEELAEFTASWLTGLAVGIVVLVVAAAALRKIRQPVWIVGCLALLACQGVGALAVANTAHNGGRLVHEFGVHALLPDEPLPSIGSSESNETQSGMNTPSGDRDDDDDDH